MKKDLTELVFIVDCSGSMGGLESDTIGGINATLAKNRKVEGDANVSIVLFDTTADVIVDRKPIAEVADLTEKEYQVRGCTALRRLELPSAEVRFARDALECLHPHPHPMSIITCVSKYASRICASLAGHTAIRR